MQVLIFELKGKMGHFRRPDTTGTHATYPFISRTALHGLLASILGLEMLDGNNFMALRLMTPVYTCTQEMSMIGKGFEKGGKDSFNRPTAVEFVVNPHYRIYYTGKYLKDLVGKLSGNESHYHTYLGCAYCLTFPKFVDVARGILISAMGEVSTRTIVPTNAISSLKFREGTCYSRVSGMQYRYLGGRRFDGTINFIYNDENRSIEFVPAVPNEGKPVSFVDVSGETICLW